MTESFESVPARVARRALIAHVPHGSTSIPARFREQMLLDDAALQREIAQMTDWHTEDLFSWLPDLGGEMLVNGLSRLVMDPERFADDADEPMAAVGQGVVYVRTTDGAPLAVISSIERAARTAEFYVPYHEALTAQVAGMLAEFGECTLLDCHSFATHPLPSELDQAPDRPDICIGTDPFHTPAELADALEVALTREGFRVRRDAPFAGCLVPLTYLGSDDRVRAVMIEVRRGLYCDEATGERSEDYDHVRESLRRACGSAFRMMD